jgi:PAS domain S-box-containing protein
MAYDNKRRIALTSRQTQGRGGALFFAALGLGYLLLAKLGLALASLHPSASPVWPPSGLGLASCLLWGNRVWPAIATGAFLANVITFGSLATSVAIAIGNTLEGVVTASLVRRWCTREEPFATPARVVVYFGVTFAPGTIISATVGVGSLVLTGYADPSKFGDIWFTWWLGDVGGQLVVAPIIVLWANANVLAFGRDDLLRMARLIVATIAVALVAFSPLIEQTPRRGVLAFLAIGPLLWAALRYCQRDTATVAFVLSSFAVWGTLAHNGPFVAANLNDSFLLLLMFVISTAVPSLVLSADVSVRRQVQFRQAFLVRKLQHRIKNQLADRKDLSETLEALRDSEARSRTQAEQLRALSDELGTTLDTAGIGITRCSRDLRYLRANNTYARIAGLPLGEIIGRPIVEVMGEAAFTTIHPYIERVLAGERVEYEREVLFRRGAESAFFRVVYVPDCDSGGSVIGWIACISDITASKQDERRLAERNTQLALAGQAALVGSYAYESDLETMKVSEGYCGMHGLPEGATETTRREWRARVHPEDLARLEESRARTLRNQRKGYNVDYRIVRAGGDVRWIESRSFISYDDGGRPRSIIGVNIDITDRKRSEERQRALVAELDHRVKNALATVSAVIYHTRQGSRSLANFAAALDGRIRSMATTHELLSSGRGQGISLTELIRRELGPYAGRRNMEINGPEVVLCPEAGQAMAMVLHELVTNAAKYGALSTRNGRVAIRWDQQLNGETRPPLVLEWQEIDGPPVVITRKSSYGTSTIRDLIPYEFGGTVDLVLASDGVRCRVELPADWVSNDREPVSEAKSPPNGAART